MGSSCTSGKKQQKKQNHNSSPVTNASNAPYKSQMKDVPSVFCKSTKENMGLCNENISDIASKICEKGNQEFLTAQNVQQKDAKAKKNVISTNLLGVALPSNNLVKTTSTMSSPSSNNVSPQSDPINKSVCSHKSGRSIQLENFILERKKFMNERGVVNYTPYTVLPPPILKNVKNSTLSRKRLSSVSDVSGIKTIRENRKKSNPTSMLYGDVDQVVIEV